MSTIIIITPPPTKPNANVAEVDGFAQADSGMSETDYDAAHDAIDAAYANGNRVRIITD